MNRTGFVSLFVLTASGQALGAPPGALIVGTSYPITDAMHDSVGGGSVYIRCDDGACETGEVAARTNVPPEEQPSAGVDYVRRSLAGLQLRDEATAKLANESVIKRAQALQQTGVASQGLVQLSVWMWEDDDDFSSLRTARGSSLARRSAVEARRAAHRASQEQVAAFVEELGGKVLVRRWLTNKLLVEVPGAAVEPLASHPLVYSVAEPDTGRPSEVPGDGMDRRLALMANQVAETGATGSIHGGEVAVGVIELGNDLNADHVGWTDYFYGPSRVLSAERCTYDSCTAAPSSTVASHGTRVASVALGSIQQGQDNLYGGTDTTTQRARSGFASEAELRYYSALYSSSSTVETAIENAVEDGVDVLNLSFNFPATCTSMCSSAYNPSGLNADLYAASSAGVVIVAPTSDCGATSGCSVQFPALHPDVLAVGALSDTYYGSWETRNTDTYSGDGYVQIVLSGGATVYYSPVSFVTLGTVRHTFGANWTYDGNSFSGTSYAAPQATGLAAMFRQWLYQAGVQTYNDAWGVGINLLLMGDGHCGSSCGANTNYVSGIYGLGVPRYFTPNSTRMGGTFGWGMRWLHIGQGEDLSWPVGDYGPEPTSVTGWKWAVAVDGTFAPQPNLAMTVVDSCNGNQVVASNARQGNRGHILLNNAASQIHGRCLVMHVNGVGVPSGGVDFWSADYYFSNDQAQHISQ